jgi:DNA helicase II / ATP-dependent DNA helicase PcrA
MTVSYRCPKAVVAFAQQWVSHIQPTDTAPEGKVEEMTHEDFMKPANLETLKGAGSAILCRNNAPNVKLALQLIRQGIPCKVEGREIGTSLKNLATKWKRIKKLDKLLDQLDVYFEKEKVKLLAKKQEAKLQIVEDQIETLRVLIASCQAEGKDTVDCVVHKCDTMFDKNVKGMLVLASIHKSKGREWNRVFWYDRAGLCPSKWARQEWQMDQEVNLMYVAATRAKQELVELLAPEKEDR